MIEKEELFKNLTEWKYPSEDKKEIFDVIEEIFNHLKDVDAGLLKRLVRNFQLIFPVKFDRNMDPILI